jgi:hypothetical protein
MLTHLILMVASVIVLLTLSWSLRHRGYMGGKYLTDISSQAVGSQSAEGKKKQCAKLLFMDMLPLPHVCMLFHGVLLFAHPKHFSPLFYQYPDFFFQKLSFPHKHG